MGNEMIRIKGTKNGLLIVLDPNHNFEEIRKNLLSKMESSRGFFKGAKFSICQGHEEIPTNQKNELEDICRQFGLVLSNDNHTVYKGIEPTQNYRKVPRITPQSDAGEAALMVKRSLRSGQRIVYPKHIVVLGDVHPGAEIVSGGSILIVGNCRGTVHAGAYGDRKAKVIARRLDPISLSIADARSHPDRSGATASECQAARLSGSKIIFEKFQAGR